MTNFSKALKTLALVVIMAGGQHLSAAAIKPPTTTTTTTPTVTSPGVAALNPTIGVNLGTTTSSTVLESSLMAVKVTKILGLIGAVTAEAAESKGSGAGAAPSMTVTGTDSGSGVNVAASSGSKGRSSVWTRASFGAIDNAKKDQKWNGQSYLVMLGGDYKLTTVFVQV